MPDINDSTRQLTDQLDKEQPLSLDHLIDTVDTIKKAREKKLKTDFDLQKEVTNLKATARNAGFDIEYDPDKNIITNVNKKAPTPSRVTRMPDGGMELEQNFDEAGKPTELDPVSKTELLGYQTELQQKAKQKYPTANAGAKPLTEQAKTAIVFGEKVNRLGNELTGLLKGKGSKEPVSRTLASGPKFVTTAMKMIPGKKDTATRAERFRDIVNQLKGSIPFAKGGKALSKVEQEVLFKLLEFGPDTSDETIANQIQEFQTEFSRMAELARSDRAALTDDDLANLSAEDIMKMKEDADTRSREANLAKMAKDDDLEPPQ